MLPSAPSLGYHREWGKEQFSYLGTERTGLRYDFSSYVTWAYQPSSLSLSLPTHKTTIRPTRFISWGHCEDQKRRCMQTVFQALSTQVLHSFHDKASTGMAAIRRRPRSHPGPLGEAGAPSLRLACRRQQHQSNRNRDPLRLSKGPGPPPNFRTEIRPHCSPLT